MNKTLTLALLTAAVTLAGCAGNPINQKTAMNYGEAGWQAVERGDWTLARENYRRAVINGQLGHSDSAKMAVYYYEYGRASGVVCEWSEAKDGLELAYEQDLKSNGPAFMSQIELGRMYKAKRDYSKSAEHFSLGIKGIKKVAGDTKDPTGYAHLLDEYSFVLEKTGQAEQAQTYKKQASEIRTSSKGQKANTDITPYGTQCKKG
ncbi:MAG: hypothetical protein OXT65_02255 [Alphaproteobacteria bacterium]|nr:hypothetical protein [Alphaproteobacteria bacterium]